MTDMTAKEMVDKLVENVVMYGTGFTKLTRDEQGNLVTSIVPIEDYMYINGKPEWVGLTDEERIQILVDAVPNKYDDKKIVEAIEAKLKEKNT
jgi:hypothetical protein